VPTLNLALLSARKEPAFTGRLRLDEHSQASARVGCESGMS
jgi:hypothetical protein